MRLMEKYFDDLSVGDSETTHRRTVTEADVTMWCMFTGDWFPIHCDKVYAEASMFKQRVAPGVMVVAMTGGLVVPAQTQTVIANYGTDRLRYPNPTFIGDTINVVNTVDSLKPRDEGSGIADLKWEVFKQDGKMVCSLILRALFKTRAADAAAEG
tara:strand:+ start:212 stop:676 length:465 start_codon:yes stop_codon:yes gene_type:complete